MSSTAEPAEPQKFLNGLSSPNTFCVFCEFRGEHMLIASQELFEER